MLSEERKQAILRIVNAEGSVSVTELVSQLNSSEATIRRALAQLDCEGRLTRVFGGAVALNEGPTSVELSVTEKETINLEEKQRIGAAAAALVRPGDFVYIDSGTTTGFLAEAVTETDAVYVTNAVAHARTLGRRGFQVLLIGGELKAATEAVVGAEAVQSLRKYRFSIGFFGTNGISLTAGYTTPDLRESAVKEEAMKHTPLGKRIVLADHDKFGVTSSITFGTLEGSVVVTDRAPDPAYAKHAEIQVAP